MSVRIIRDFAFLIGWMRNGEVAAALNHKLSEALEALAESGDGAAELTLKVKIKRENERLVFTPLVSMKPPPERGLGSDMAFAAEDGFALEHPNQGDLFATRIVGKAQA